jgi:DNA-binding NarL/FixJ family response regulator
MARRRPATSIGSAMSTAATPPVTVVLADPHPRQRTAVRAALDAHPDLRVVAATAHRHLAAELLTALEPDAAVIDVALLASSGFPLQDWRPVSRAVALVAVGPCADERLARQLLRCGFAGYVPIDRLRDELAEAVLRACRPVPVP